LGRGILIIKNIEKCYTYFKRAKTNVKILGSYPSHNDS
jgi:hypothetical protein